MRDETHPGIGFVRARPAGTVASAAGQRPEILAVAPCDAGEISPAVDVLAEAFLEDPTWSWAFPDPAQRRRWWTFCVANALRYPWTLRTAGFEAVSVWIPAGGTEFSAEDEARIPGILAGLVGDRAPEVTELLHRFERAHPHSEPHYYLSLLGTQKAQRGRGLGMALLRENLARIDAERTPAYLESSNPANNRLYESVGFETVVTFRTPGDGPLVTGMWRERRN